jgi:hypothetical protein
MESGKRNLNTKKSSHPRARPPGKRRTLPSPSTMAERHDRDHHG